MELLRVEKATGDFDPRFIGGHPGLPQNFIGKRQGKRHFSWAIEEFFGVSDSVVASIIDLFESNGKIAAHRAATSDTGREEWVL